MRRLGNEMSRHAERASNRERQAAFAERMTAAGFVLAREWVHAIDAPRVRAYVERLNKARGGDPRRGKT